MVSSLTRTSRMGYTKDRMRLLKPQAPTCKVQHLGPSPRPHGHRDPHRFHTGTLPEPTASCPQSRPYLAVKVAQAAVALGGSIELGHLGDVEATGEVRPDGLSEAVAYRHAHLVPGLCFPGRLVQEVPAQLTYILHDLGVAGYRFG